MTQNSLYTVVETPTFSHQWPDYWDEKERDEFVAWLAGSPEAGDVIPGSGGCRKVRRSRSGKRGGVRVIHYNRLREGLIYLLLIHAKNARDAKRNLGAARSLLAIAARRPDVLREVFE